MAGNYLYTQQNRASMEAQNEEVRPASFSVTSASLCQGPTIDAHTLLGRAPQDARHEWDRIRCAAVRIATMRAQLPDIETAFVRADSRTQSNTSVPRRSGSNKIPSVQRHSKGCGHIRQIGQPSLTAAARIARDVACLTRESVVPARRHAVEAHRCDAGHRTACASWRRPAF
jgi:hypothetical protein